MNTFIYRSNSRLACECDSEVILCVIDDLMADGSNYLLTTLVSLTTTTGCDGCKIYNHYLEYDENLLADPTHVLNSSEVTGLFCNNCLASYLQWLIDHQTDWHILGNAATVDGTNFLGTTDNVPFTVRCNNKRAIKVLPDPANYCPIFINGCEDNVVTANISGAAILSGGYVGGINQILATNSQNPALDAYNSVIVGGDLNTIDTGLACLIGAGERNIISGLDMFYCAIVAGNDNSITSPTVPDKGYSNFIGAGRVNVITESDYCSILDADNCLIQYSGFSGIYSGENNEITRALRSCGIFSGAANIVTGLINDDDDLAFSAILSGHDNRIEGALDSSVIVSGHCNDIKRTFQLPGSDSVYNNAILSGNNNELIDTNYGVIIGGSGLKLGSFSFGYQDRHNIDFGCRGTINPHTDLSGFNSLGYFGNIDIWIGNVDGVARKLKLFEPNTTMDYGNTNYSSLEAQAQNSNIEYKLPAAAGIAGQSLKIQSVVGSVVTLEWA